MSHAQLAASLDVPHVGYLAARCKWWDLILFADSASARAFNPRIPKVMAYHSLGCGKVIGNEHYKYGSRVCDPQGEPLFAHIFEASQTTRDQAVRARPALEPVIAVVGDLRADALLARNEHRSEIRKSLGFDEGDTVVMIQSTWGPASLMETMGESIVAEASKMIGSSRYRFILSTHPNHWTGGYAERHPWGEFIDSQRTSGFVVIGPGEDFEPFHIAADIVVTDHTGISLNFALLQKPLVFVPIAAGTVMPESWEARLAALSPTLTSASDLAATVGEALQHYPLDELAALAHQIDSNQGKAAQAMSKEIYDVLRLSPAEKLSTSTVSMSAH